MAEFIDEARWREVAHRADWYLELEEDYLRLMKQAKAADPPVRERIKEEAYSLIEELIAEDKLYLGVEGPDFDSERESIDTVIIHHTSNQPGMRLGRLNAMHLIRLYAAHFANPPQSEVQIKGQPIYSGHFRDGAQVFWAYHWLVRRDGGAERLLGDEEIGWQAGDWEVNCRSVAICFDDDLGNASPTSHALEAARDIILSNYPSAEVKGHLEVNQQSACPGGMFIEGWKAQLLPEREVLS